MSRKIIVETVVKADPDKAWNYYTAPEHIVNWNFATKDWQCPRAENDLRPGGKYAARMEAKDGSFGFDFEAVYDDVEIGKSFQYTMPDGRVVDADFQDLGGETRVTIAFDPENQNDTEMQRVGWQAILDNYRRYTDSN